MTAETGAAFCAAKDSGSFKKDESPAFWLGDIACNKLFIAIETMERCKATTPDISVRVEWALQTVKELGGLENAQLGLRALRAAVRDESDIADPFLRRKWLLFLGVMEIGVGRAGEAIQHLVSSLELARDIGDRVGVFMAWGNVALLASMAGQYEDAVTFSTRAIELIEDEERSGESSYGKFLAGPLFNRGNAFRRLGHLEEAVRDVSSSLALTFEEPSNVLTSIRLTKGLALLAGIHFERGELARGTAHLAALKGRAEYAQLPSHINRLIELVSAEAAASAGLWEESMSDLERLLTSNVCDGFELKEDLLYALNRIARLAGREDKADWYLTLLADGMRTNAEMIIGNFSRLPDAVQDLEAALQRVDRLVGGIGQPSLRSSGSTWENLIAMAASAIMFEDRTGEHGVRVAALCAHVGNTLGLPPNVARLAQEAALLHDIGKVATPSSLLSKWESLSDHEEQILLRHADDGARLIESSSLPNRGRIANIVRLHHQPFDGLGSRLSVRGDAIPLETRLLTACDRFDALITGRPRRKKVSVPEALREVLHLAGRELDPTVAAALIETVRELSRGVADLIEYLAQGAKDYGYTSARRRLLEG